MNKIIKSKVKTITLEILESIFDAVEDIAEISLTRKGVYRVLYNTRRQRLWNNSSIGRWIDTLKRQGYLTEKKSQTNDNSIVFTNKGKMKLLEKISNRITKDHKYRFLSFDVPEYRRSDRNKFRKSIKRLGFVQIQQSLWVIDKDVSDIVEMLAYEFSVERYIAYIISERSDIDGIIEKKIKEQQTHK